MRVLERKDWSTWRVVVKCPKCESALEAEPMDICAHHYEDDGPGRPSSWAYTVECSICHNELYLKNEQIPTYLQEQAQASTSRRKQ